MAIEGAPERARHGYCFYCHEWHDLTDGTRVIPQATGPLSGMRATGAFLTGDASTFKFVCHRCARRRRLTGRVIFGTLLAAIGLALLLERLGLI
jgi:hypothetical protein